MAWRVEFDASAEKALRGIDHTWQQRIVSYLEEIRALPDPKTQGKPLTASMSGLLRYRVRDYRLVRDFHDDVLIIRVIKVGHRRHVYD